MYAYIDAQVILSLAYPAPIWVAKGMLQHWYPLANQPLPKELPMAKRQELQRLERNFYKGFLFAALDAFHLCKRLDVDAPLWVQLGRKEIDREIFDIERRRPGRPVTRVTKYRSNLIDQLRLDEFENVRKHQKDAWEDRKLIKASGKKTSMTLDEFDQWLLKHGHEKDLQYQSYDSFNLTKEELAGTPLYADVESLRTSCKKARARRKRDRKRCAITFDFLGDTSLRYLGLHDLTQEVMNRKRKEYLEKTLGENLENVKFLVSTP